MDLLFENKVIKNFFASQSSERLIYESKKKRDKLFDKLSHTCEDYLKKNIILKKSKMPDDIIEIIKFLSENKNDNCYVMAMKSTLDGEYVNLKVALNTLYRNGLPYMLVSSSGNKMYLETEYDFDVHYSYFLYYKA